MAEAEPLIVTGYDGMKKREASIPPAGRQRLVEAALRIVDLYESWDKPDEAKNWKDRLSLEDLPSNVFSPP